MLREKKGYKELQAEEIHNVILLIKGNKTERYKYAASARQKASGVPCPTLGTLVDRCRRSWSPECTKKNTIYLTNEKTEGGKQDIFQECTTLL